MKTLICFLLFIPLGITAQTMDISITLVANEGGFHTGKTITLEDTATKAAYSGRTGDDGNAVIAVPVNAVYDVKIPGYTRRKLIAVPNVPGGTMHSTMTFSRNMEQQDKAFAMSDAEKNNVDRFADALPDTTYFRTWNQSQGWSPYNCVHLTIELSDLDGKPLAGEVVTLTGRKRHKSLKGTTNSSGKLILQVPKGDDYDLSFYYHKNFEFTQYPYSKGTSDVEWSFEYIGTKAYKKKLEEEAKRVAEEKKRLDDERKAFLSWCSEHHYTEEEGMKIKMLGYSSAASDKTIESVMERNRFKNPLIVCDVTGSMSPYMSQVYDWFKQNAKDNPKSQFVFFNDGDNMPDSQKKIGETGGIYYSPPVTSDSLLKFMSYAASRGGGGDCPENNMEALIKGTKQAKFPYTDIVMIADNNAPVKDISLLDGFRQPVHIIVCGAGESWIHPDYLRIAWKTKGSVHTAGADYNNIGDLKDGESIRIGTTEYRLMKNEFIRM